MDEDLARKAMRDLEKTLLPEIGAVAQQFTHFRGEFRDRVTIMEAALQNDVRDVKHRVDAMSTRLDSIDASLAAIAKRLG